MEDTTLQVVDIRALPVEEGAEAVVLAMLVAVQLPIAGPDGQPIIVPTKVYKVPLSKNAAQEVLKTLSEESDKLPEPKRASGIVVPGSPADVDAMAQNIKRFGG